MWTVWLVVQIVLGVLGSLLVWFTLAGIVSRLLAQRRAHAAHHPPRPPARP